MEVVLHWFNWLKKEYKIRIIRDIYLFSIRCSMYHSLFVGNLIPVYAPCSYISLCISCFKYAIDYANDEAIN